MLFGSGTLHGDPLGTKEAMGFEALRETLMSENGFPTAAASGRKLRVVKQRPHCFSRGNPALVPLSQFPVRRGYLSLHLTDRSLYKASPVQDRARSSQVLFLSRLLD